MMNDEYQSSPAAGAPLGMGLVSWGDYAIGYNNIQENNTTKTAEPGKFQLWRDMVEEPGKYGDDIGDWLDLDAELRESPGRWRIVAHWEWEQKRIAWNYLEALLWKAWNEYGDRKQKAATLIQAMWRGHSVRNRTPWMNCCMCLSHHVSPIKTSVGFMCLKCSEDGPHTDLVGMEDPWDWFRAERKE